MKNFKKYLKEYNMQEHENDRLGAAINKATQIKNRRDIEDLTGYNIDKNEDFMKLFDNLENMPQKTQHDVWRMYKDYMNTKKKSGFEWKPKGKKKP
jgi:hypothetical protein